MCIRDRLITEKNPLPFITGTICAHNCMTKCMRNYYDEPVNIRATKLVAAERGYDDYMAKIKAPVPVTDGRKVAVIGGGPTGMAAAYFVGRAGIPVTIFERSGVLGGVVRQVIPAFRISDDAIDHDVALMFKMGVEVKLNTEAPSVAELKAQGYTHIFFAVGAWKAGRLDIPGNVVDVYKRQPLRSQGGAGRVICFIYRCHGNIAGIAAPRQHQQRQQADPNSLHLHIPLHSVPHFARLSSGIDETAGNKFRRLPANYTKSI